jgi:IS4 transposase
LFDSAASEIADIYKKRWDIEVFFKFVKQHLQFKHFISHSQNGMIVYLYSILVAAILFTIFKVSNKLAGFKIPLLKFCLLLEKEIIRDIVVLSGGDFELVRYKL